MKNLLTIIVCALIIIASLVALGSLWSDCHRKGGTMVKGYLGPECVRKP